MQFPQKLKKLCTLVERQDDYSKIDKDLIKLKVYDLETQKKYKALSKIID